MRVHPRFAPRSPALASGLLLLLYAVGGLIFLAVFNGILLTLLLRLFLDREQIQAARMWVVPLAFLLAIAGVVLYEWRRAQAADLIGPIHSAIQEALSRIPFCLCPRPECNHFSPSGLAQTFTPRIDRQSNPILDGRERLPKFFPPWTNFPGCSRCYNGG